MSQQNLELVQGAVESFAATDELPWAVLHDEVEVHDHDIMDASDYRGHAGFGRWVEDWEAAWSDSTLEPEEFLDAGDHVVVFILQKTTGQGRGVALERHDAMVFEVQGSQVVRVDYYNNRDEALEQVRLNP
jgi:ketosteroid isomerase-like protein